MRTYLTLDLTPQELDQWQGFLAKARSAHPEQDPCFAPVLRADGHDVIFAMGWQGDDLVAVGMFALRPHPFLPGRYSDAMAYSGPVCDDLADMAEFLTLLARSPQLGRVGRLRITPYWIEDAAETIAAWLAQNSWHSFEDGTMRHTGLIDISGTETDILARFSQTGRRKVRKAEKSGLTVEQNNDPASVTDFVARLNAHHANRRIGVISEPAFAAMQHQIFRHDDIGTALTLRHDGNFVAGVLVHRSHDTAHFMHSVHDDARLAALDNLRVSPFLLLQAMKWANAKGCRVFDIEGYKVDPDPSDRLYNIYKYKSEFSPRPVLRVAGHGKILNPVTHLTGNLPAIVRSRAKALKSRLARRHAAATRPAG